MKDKDKTVFLVEQAKQGDETALDLLFERYYDRMHRQARRRLGPALRRDVDSVDIVQQSLVVAARKLRDFDMINRSSLMRWLRVIIENQIRGERDRQGAGIRDHKREVPLDDLDLAHDADDSPIEALSKKELREQVEGLLARLDERYRELIRLRHFENMPWDEIAERLGRPSAGAARMMYRSALLELSRLARTQAEPPSA